MHTRGRLGQLAIASAASTSAGSSGSGNPKAASILPMLDKFHDIIGGIHVPVDDGVDKLNRKYTLLVFLFLALPIFTKQYIGDPIECFAPVYFAEHQSRYINSYCWTQSTYYMVPVGDPEDDGDQQEPPDRIMPDEVDYFIGFETVTHIGNERLRRVRVSYYQWAPLILLVQGLCFYIPFLIWNSCANNAGVKLRRLLKKASDIASLPPGCQQREALLAEFVDQFHTLVTGEAGWCADLQCGGLGGAGGGGLNSNSNSSASSSASANSSNVQQQPHHQSQHSNGPSRGVAQTGLRGGGGGGASGNVQQHNHPGAHSRSGGGGGGGAHSGNTNVDSNQDDHDRHHRSNNNNGCCLISIPIIGSLLACCLKPCSSFGLVGPSKYLCLLYLAVKSAYVFNVGLQFFLLGQFLGRGYLKHGLELINRLIVNGDWWASPRFPLSTLCQVRADMSGGLRSYTCQCVLPINVFNEKIFSVVWFYMAFLMPLNVLSLLFWIYRTFETNRLSYIRLCLWRTRLVELNQIHRTVRRLSQSYLGWDGVFLLRLIEHNHGSIMATLIMSRLWEFYANQMKLQEDANQLALANNAQHTLSNTTTAISNQHQLLAAAAAAAAAAASNQPLGPPLPGHLSVGPGSQGVGGGPGHHNVGAGGAGGANHGPSHGQSHGLQQTGHSHGPPLMPTQHQAGGAHFAASHAHGPNPHGGHFAPAAAGGGQVNHGPLQQQQQQHMAPLVGHGPHAHHSGQISQPGAHHPLHAANTHHTHAHVAAAAGHHGHPLQAGPFASNMNANILAQLQQQHQHHHHQQPPGSGTTALSAAQSHNVQQQSSQTQQQQQGSASGNVAAAVAALAAAAAANSTSGSTPGQQQQQLQASSGSNSTAAVSGGSGSGAASSAAIHLHSLLQPTSTGAPTGSGLNNSTNTGTSNSNQSTAASGAVAAASARSQQATSTIQTSTSSTGANNVSASNSSGAQTNNNNNNQPASSVAPISSSSTSGQQQQQQASSLGPQTSSANNGSSSATSATTSFIQVAQPGVSGNASGGAGAGVGGVPGSGPQSGSGPPLPPPPPAHIVAAVAAASATNPTITPNLPTNMGVAAPGMARSGPPSAVLAANRGQASQVTPQQQQNSAAQPAPPPHTNPVLFNLKSSSLQAAATNNARQYSPHTIKR